MLYSQESDKLSLFVDQSHGNPFLKYDQIEGSTYLDGQYGVFGYVTDGMDIVDEICESAEPTDSNGSIDPDAQPVTKPITIQTQE